MSLPAITAANTVWQYFHEKLGLHPSEDFRGVCHLAPLPPGMPVHMDDVAVAVGYNAFIGRSCCMHVVVNKPEHLNRAMVRQAFEFPFITCGCEVVFGLVDSTNQAAIDFDKRLGFKESLRIAHAGIEGDLVLLTMTRAQCKWLRPH